MEHQVQFVAQDILLVVAVELLIVIVHLQVQQAVLEVVEMVVKEQVQVLELRYQELLEQPILAAVEAEWVMDHKDQVALALAVKEL